MNLLSIGGSDPSGGAGIQSDIKTFEQLNAYGFTVVTAITAQNTQRFESVMPVSKKILREQIRNIFSDFEINGIKISMVYNSQIIKIISEELKNKKIPIVVDPVIKSTTGGILLEKIAIKNFKNFIIPLATVITPNKVEAEFLTKIKINSENTLQKAAKKIQKFGAKNVVITGIEKRAEMLDFILEGDTKYVESAKKIANINHGSGCNYSSALIYAIARWQSLKKATKFAKKYTYDSIKNAKNIGSGIIITQNKNQDRIATELNQSISKFVLIKDIYKNIPECQTNFVFSKNHPKSIKDVLGVEGRIVKAGKKVMVAGNLEYGGSKHVATAVIAMNEKFPEIRSAVNLKYQPRTIARLKKFIVSHYDRSNEPENVKSNGTTVGWGIKVAIKNSKVAPDLVYHEGDFGKEPMTIVFGENPSKVLEKTIKII
jgi:hydroxymethylpyrimidine/phosphomethylpyrimidine kinase